MLDLEEQKKEQETLKPFGDRLRESRESLGLTLVEIAKTLNLDINILKALEESAVDKLPPPIYVQGYIKAYTKALNISSKAVHADYLKSLNKETAIELKPRSPLPIETHSGTPIVKTFTVLLAVLAIVAAVFGVYNYYATKVDSIDTQMASADTVNSEQIEIPFQQETNLIEEDAQVTTTDEAGIDQTGIDQTITNTAVEEGSAARPLENTVVAKRPEPMVAATIPGDTLKINAEEESWAEIHDADKIRIYFGMVKPGDVLVLQGRAPFDVFLGNAVSISIAVNDVDVDISDYVRMNNVAHFKVSERSNHIVFH